MRKVVIFAVLFTAFISLVCGKKGEKLTGQSVNDEELVRERFALYKDYYANKDIDGIMSLIFRSYWDPYNHSQEAYRSWLQTTLAGWEWRKPVEMNIIGDLKVMGESRGRPWAYYHNAERKTWAVNNSQNLLMTTKSVLHFSWQASRNTPGIWFITRISGTVGQMTTQPSVVSGGSEVTVAVYTLPEGAPLTAYNTKSVSVNDWNGKPISLQDDGNGRYYATFSVPTMAGNYTLTATVSDTTSEEIITLQHTFAVQ